MGKLSSKLARRALRASTEHATSRQGQAAASGTGPWSILVVFCLLAGQVVGCGDDSNSNCTKCVDITGGGSDAGGTNSQAGSAGTAASSANAGEGQGGIAGSVSGAAGTMGGTAGSVSGGAAGTMGGTAGSVSGAAGAGAVAGELGKGGDAGAAGEVSTTLSCADNLLSGDLGGAGNWVGGDPTDLTDNPCGVQGHIYSFGDGISCALPTDDNLCSNGQCCLTGATIVDVTSYAWGCGIGLALNEGNETPPVQASYSGQARGFRIQLTGSVPAEVRVSYTQVPDPRSALSPFVNGESGASNLSVPGTYDVMFDDVSCPTWGIASGCTPPMENPYALEVQVAGGSVAASFSICITEITPLMQGGIW